MSITERATGNAKAASHSEVAASKSVTELPDIAMHPVIFFDGVCGLCSKWVDFTLARDCDGLFRFAPLQGETAQRALGDWAAELHSVVLLEKGGCFRKSDAVCRIFAKLGGICLLASWIMRCIPRPIRNWGYDVVARRRYQWFGRHETCRLPTANERGRFLP